MESENAVKSKLEELQRDLGRKLKFEDAIAALFYLFRDRYPSASPSLRKSLYSAVCRAAIVLKTRYTSPGFWIAGLGLFELAYSMVSDSSEKQHLKNCVAQAKEILNQEQNPSQSQENTPPNRGYLFEGHLTVDPEPPQPQWLVQSNLLTTAATLFELESSRVPSENNELSETAANVIQALTDNLDNVLPEILENDQAPRAPPASKEVVANLPVITITDEILSKLGKDAECAICKDDLAVNDKMQELPCKHTFHPPCLKPWLVDDDERDRRSGALTMESLKENYHNQSAEDIFHSSGSRVCMMNSNWRDEQHPSLINFISNFLNTNSFRLNLVPIAPDLIFNCGGLSVAFIFITSWHPVNASSIYNRVKKLKKQFANFYVLVVLSTREQNDSFVRSYFEYGMEFGRPTFVPVHDVEMGFEKIVKIAHSRGASKQQDAISKLKAERKRSVEVMENFYKVITSIPGIDHHYANSLGQALGSIEAIAKASTKEIMENTDLPADKANIIRRFFRDPKFYLGPKIDL